jgi:uncharacterized protein YbjT (DUF2867 family)
MEDLVHRTSVRLLQVGEALGLRNMDPESGRIFVTGGTGVIGHRVALRLLRAGYPEVRLGSHNPEILEDMNKLGAEIADFSWDKEETYEKALAGVKSVLCTAAYVKDWQTHFPAFLEACKKAGVRHFVKLSFYHARLPGDPFHEVPLVKAHGDCDEMLVETITPSMENVHMGDIDVGLDMARPHMSYTILYATHFMSNPFTFQGRELRDSQTLSTFYGASGNKGVNYVSPNDIAEVMVRVLLEPCSHYNKEYTITGPEAITDQQVADLLGKHLKKSVMYVDQPLHEFESELKLSGDPEWMVNDLVTLEKMKATGQEENLNFLSDDFEKICGHPAETFESYLQMTEYMTKVELGAESELKPLKDIPAASA